MRAAGPAPPLPMPDREHPARQSRSHLRVVDLRDPSGLLGRIEAHPEALNVSFVPVADLSRAVAAGYEALVAFEDGTVDVGAHATVMVTPSDRVALTADVEWDPAAAFAVGPRRAATAGGSVFWHVRADRLSRIGLVGRVRRAMDDAAREDLLAVVLQASL